MGNRTLACLRSESIKSDQIKSVIEQNSLVFNPVADNKTLISSPAIRRSLGAIARVPVLIGSNAQEGRVFVQGQNDVPRYVQNTFGNSSAVVKAVLSAYPVGKNELDTPFDAIAQIMTEFSFQCVSTF
jgi:carboxylesterase type B